MPKIVHFGEFLTIWSLRSNSVTRQATFKKTKIGRKRQNWKIKMRHFGWFSNTVHHQHPTLLLGFYLITCPLQLHCGWVRGIVNPLQNQRWKWWNVVRIKIQNGLTRTNEKKVFNVCVWQHLWPRRNVLES